MGEITPSESLSRVTYAGIDGMHSQKTKQPYIRSARKNRTRKKSAVEEEPWKLPRRKPLKTGRPKNKPELKKLSWVEDGSGKQREKVTLRREKRALQ